MKKILSKIKRIRNSDTQKHVALRIAAAVLFPAFLTVITEMAHMESVLSVFRFAADKPGVIIFDIMSIGVIYAAITLISRQVFISAAICSFMFYVFSFIEFFKYESNGMHFNIADIFMSPNLGDVVSFTIIYPTLWLVVAFLLLLAYVAALFTLNIRLPLKRKIGVSSGICALALFVGFFAVQPVYSKVYAFFTVNTGTEHNLFASEEKFRENLLIANVFESISKQFEYILFPPEDYSEEKVGEILAQGKSADALYTDSNTGVAPDIVVVMCESFTDLRKIDGIDVPESVYKGFDAVVSQPNAFSGTAIVPTLGNGTVQSEFELLFGLPVKSLNNAFIPHSILEIDGQPEKTFPQFYKSNGYSTAYVHPFNSDFYSRDRFYQEYGFDRLLFADDFSDDAERFYDFIDDKSVFDQILDLLDESASPTYIHATTMQNHKPYYHEDFDGTELEFYYAGAEKTTFALYEFYNAVLQRETPTIVMFVGDHFPYFGSDNDIYRETGITAENCGILYEQTFVMFANYGVDFSLMPEESVSLFYLPHLLNAAAYGEPTDFMSAMLSKMSELPIYADTQSHMEKDNDLDILTYDRTAGEQYSD